ncbi:Amino acid transporter AVT1H [Linum grandiflorum]
MVMLVQAAGRVESDGRCDVCVEDNYNDEHKVCNCGGDHHHHQISADDHQANGSFAHAVINMIGMLIGLGQLSTPYALQNGGWTSIFLLLSLALICTYTSHLLAKCLHSSPKSQSYADIGRHAFGSKGQIVASTFIYLEIFMALVSYTISLHDNLATVFSSATTHQFAFTTSWISTSQLLTLVAVLVALPSLWIRNLSSISFLSSAGILMSFVIFGCVVLTASFGGVAADHGIPVIRVRNIPAVSGLYVFSYGGHIVFPNLYKSMKDPTKFTKVSIVSFGAVTALYTCLAFLGAKMFGAGVSSQITLNLPPHLIFTKVALWATVITPMTKYALEFAPLAIQLEQALPSWMTPRTKMVVRGTVGSILLLAILVIALSMPYFEHVLGLTGSLVTVSICVVLPCVFYLKISHGKLRRSVLVLNWGLIGIGCVLGATGTISSSKLLISSLRGGHNLRSS